jgi:hypothetical protein
MRKRTAETNPALLNLSSTTSYKIVRTV